MPTYTVAVYYRGKWIGWIDTQRSDPLDAESGFFDRLQPNEDLAAWMARNQVRATVGAEPVRLVLAEDKQ